MSQFHTGEHEAFRPVSSRHDELSSNGRQTLPLYKVILHDPGDALMHVVRSVMELTRFCRAEATHKMWEAHHRGQSVILKTWLERAELYVEQFADRKITVSVAPA